ncbi:DUF6301 family protein [Nocardia sp. NPDC058519]|uniref:DUF6301 family protein n=1 Tax=Nocardia sp. NPDC058519 TaxID=3346535 RepID=UPI00365F18E1
MHVDIEGATRMARLATEFDWSWAVDDLEPFCAAAGWEIVELGKNGASLRTNLRVDRPEARMSGRLRTMDYISAFATDLADDSTPMTQVRPLLDGGFADLIAALSPLLGTPSRFEPGPQATVRWDLPKVVVELSMTPSAIHQSLKSRAYQAWMDEPEPEYGDED